MEETKQRLKVYCETSFWSYLNGGRTPLEHIALKQASTLQWWEEIAPSCAIYVSPFVTGEVADGNASFAERRQRSMMGMEVLDGFIPEVENLSDRLIEGHALPATEATDASHIATAAVYGMDVLLTWNCRHMANPITLPKTASIISDAGYQCPIIITPKDFLERKEELGYED